MSSSIDIVDLQKKVAQHEIHVSRFDIAIDRMSEVSTNVSKLLAVHEQRIEAQEELTKAFPILLEQRRQEQTKGFSDVYERLGSTEQGLRQEMSAGQKEILQEIKALGAELKDDVASVKKDIEEDIDRQFFEMEERVTKLERLAWIVIGAATLLGFLIPQLLSYLDLGGK